MNILSRYIGKTVIFTTLLTMFLIVSIDMLFLLVNELRALGEGDYTLAKIFQYVLLVMPSRLYFVFPMASLVGALLGLSLLAEHSELIVMRAAGVSILQISGAVLKGALLLVLAITLMGEFVVPQTTRYAEILREKSVNSDETVITPQGTWIRSGENFVRIKEILTNGALLEVIRYEFDENNQLKSAASANRVKFSADTGTWMAYEVEKTNFNQQEISVEQVAEESWPLTISPRLLNVLREQPESLSMLGLLNYIHYLEANDLRTQEYSLTFWKKFWQPLATLVMVFIAIPVIFGPLRSATMGLRIIAGVMLGFAFYVLNQLFGPLSLVYAAFPPALAALLPSLIFAALSLWLFRRL